MRALIAALVLAILATGCSDGKLNLLLVFRTDRDEDDLPEFPPPFYSSAVAKVSSSSVAAPSSSSEEISSSSEELELSSSSSVPSSSSVFSSSSIPSSSSISSYVPSSSSRGARSSSSKAYLDYPDLEVDQPGVKKGWASRYWDGCKPHCSHLGPEHIGNPEPWAICRNCDKNNNEMPAYYLHPDADEWWPGMYVGTPSGCDPHDIDLWQRSPAYAQWKTANPAYDGSPSYTCWDMAPHVINDTLAYAFAATPSNESNCGKCFQLQFDGDDHYNLGTPRDTHRAIKGKTLIVLSSNVGHEVEKDQFDIMIPAGGLGAFPEGFPSQIGVARDDLGKNPGGFLSTCIEEVKGDYYKTEMKELQDCVSEKCRKVFGNKSKELLDGCLFMADWYMAADNPTLVYKQVECPQYLTDKYRSTIHTTKPPPLSQW